MLTLEVLMASQLRQVYDWNHAHDIEPFETYECRLLQPNWAHYAIMDGEKWIGALSLELLSPAVVSAHIAKEPGGDRHALRRLLIRTEILLFKSGIQKIIVEIMQGNENARMLAADCGLRVDAKTRQYQYLTLDAAEYFTNPEWWDRYDA